MKKIFLIVSVSIFVLALLTFTIFLIGFERSMKEKTKSPTSTTTTLTTRKSGIFAEPILGAKSRITKKPFGIYITPQNSPVRPEKFTGYHTGIDFETTPEEANKDVPINAVCSGRVRLQQTVEGYGGVIIQDCVIEGQTATILYGHLNLRQVHVLTVGQEIKSGERIAVLAQANSELSGGERKHLHLGVHKGTSIDFRGYVQNQPELSSWLDPQKYL